MGAIFHTANMKVCQVVAALCPRWQASHVEHLSSRAILCLLLEVFVPEGRKRLIWSQWTRKQTSLSPP
jgi:hypothetical protein